MNIGKKYKIESDALNVVLFEREVTKKGKHIGKENWRPVGYYSSLLNALDGLINKEINETGLKVPTEVLSKVEQLSHDIHQALQPEIVTACKTPCKSVS